VLSPHDQRMDVTSKPIFRYTIEPLRSRESSVADAIRDAILHGIFKPGDKLDQQQIADDLHVSRSPVREALRTLGAEHLVTIIPNRGAIVAERTLAELGEMLFIRLVLEGAAAERAAPRMSRRGEEQLADILRRADRTDDFEELLVLNNEFHMTVYAAYPQPILIGHIQQLRNQFGPYNRLYLDQPGNRAVAWADHRRIFEACVKRDGDLARQETIRHLEGVVERIVSAIGEA